jgi:hypothetical protein
MSSREQAFLRSEVATLNSLLEGLPEGQVIERIGLQHRLREAEKRLTESDPYAPAIEASLASIAEATESNDEARSDRIAEMQKVLDTPKDEDINEREERYTGVLLGVLPESRRFECRTEDGRLLSGKLVRSIQDIGAFKRRWENREAELRFQIVSVRGCERYTLIGAEARHSDSDEDSED